ncbi:MAG: hypothetical protein MK135_13235 [Polyangiaceae bacterium]|nr:hypothetical protein [Polyangiaceae bacterium]
MNRSGKPKTSTHASSGPSTSSSPGLSPESSDQFTTRPVTGNSGRFGTFAGVFTPSILTILGVVMYLRFGWVVGAAGLRGALLIVVISHLITLATGLSVSSIATNRQVGAGGPYYIISRSLGAPAGAAIGIPLFLGQALSVSFYVVGFVESLEQLLPGLPAKPVGLLICILLTGLSLKGAELALKAQFIVMAAIGLSLISFLTGHSSNPPSTLHWDAPANAPPFAAVFAVFFPAVTGIMAGLGMSGDLKNPRRSLPRGTMLAVLVGFIVYMVFPFWLAQNATNEELISNNRIVWDISSIPALIYVGVWGATLSSAIGSLLTAPRTAQALAVDGLLPQFLGKGHGPYSEPRVALVATFMLAAVGILLGNLNIIANVLTMFFLATYGLTNLASGLEKFAASPSFRPDFRVPAWVSLSGALACFYVMSIIDLPAMVAALIVCALIYLWVQRRSFDTTYGDARHGIWSAIVRTALHQLRRTEYHALNWRPNLIIMGGAIERRPYLLELGSTIVQERGIVTYFELLKGPVEEFVEVRQELLRTSEQQIRHRYPNVFYRVDVTPDIYEGALNAAQSYGIGSFEANTLMLGWLKKSERSPPFVQLLRSLTALDRSLLLVHYDEQKQFGRYKKIHIWWGGFEGNGGLMLLLAFLLQNSRRWRRATVSVMTVVADASEHQAREQKLRATLEQARLDAEPRVIVRGGRQIQEIMESESQNADLAIIGIRLPGQLKRAEKFVDRMNLLLSELPSTLMVHSARGFQGEDVLFDNSETQTPPEVEENTPSGPSTSPSMTAEPNTDEVENIETATEPHDPEAKDPGLAPETEPRPSLPPVDTATHHDAIAPSLPPPPRTPSDELFGKK